MEAKVNESGYAALKKLGQTGQLLFELPSVQASPLSFFELKYIYSALVEELIKVSFH